MTIGDTIASCNDVESKVDLFAEDNRDHWHPKLKEYINGLSPLQRKIAYMIADNYTRDEICNELHITESHYNNSVKRMFAAEKIAPLRSLVERK